MISNGSDLALPIKQARPRVPVGTVHPGTNYPAGALSGSPEDGVGGHWWRQLAPADYLAYQLPDPAGTGAPPAGEDTDQRSLAFDDDRWGGLTWTHARPAPRGPGFHVEHEREPSPR